MNILLSIKPRYAKLIMNGEKHCEFRKILFKQKVNKVYVYASFPIKRILGYFTFDIVEKDSPAMIWRNNSLHAGISEDQFFKYFNDKKIAYAIHVKEYVLFKVPINPKKMWPEFKAPQNFLYLEDDIEHD